MPLDEPIRAAWADPEAWRREISQRYLLVVIKPLSAVAEALGLDFDNKNGEYVRYHNRLIQPLVSDGFGVVQFENIGHALEARKRARAPPRRSTRHKRELWEEHPHAPPVYVHVDAACKAATWSAARLLVFKQHIFLPASARDLLAELRMLKVALTPSGAPQIETGGRDLAAAFMLSLQPYRRGSEWRSAVVDAAEWLERRAPVAEVPEALLDMPRVKTGAGLRVPRLPAWVGTSGVSLPPAARPEADTAAARREADLATVRDRVAAALEDNHQRGSK